MKKNIARSLALVGIFISLTSCSDDIKEKGFAVSTPRTTEEKPDGISSDALSFETRPTNVLLTGNPKYRLSTIYKVNYNSDSSSFVGSNGCYYGYEEFSELRGNQWHGNFMPGIATAYGYNMINVSHYNIETEKQKSFFENPVLIKTVYYPSFTQDTLNSKAVVRDFYIISAYDDDTNKDGFINVRDLRRIYYFDGDANNKRALLPTNYSAYKSEYDSANDYMYIFAQLDENKNGKIDKGEETHIFWVDLKNPARTGKQY